MWVSWINAQKSGLIGLGRWGGKRRGKRISPARPFFYFSLLCCAAGSVPASRVWFQTLEACHSSTVTGRNDNLFPLKHNKNSIFLTEKLLYHPIFSHY
jgi:hypothetical protein